MSTIEITSITASAVIAYALLSGTVYALMPRRDGGEVVDAQFAAALWPLYLTWWLLLRPAVVLPIRLVERRRNRTNLPRAEARK
jgi:hypothetical protein